MTTKFQVKYLPTASDDMDDIYCHIAFRIGEKGAAKRQIDRLYRAVRSLSTFPERHPKVDWEPQLSAGVRRMPVDNYVIYYHVNLEEALVHVVRVVYGGRDVENILNNE